MTRTRTYGFRARRHLAQRIRTIKRETPRMNTGAFWKATVERAVKTVAQVLLTFLGADLVDVFHVDWERALGISAGAAVVSVLTSLASSKLGNDGPSLAGEHLDTTPGV